MLDFESTGTSLYSYFIFLSRYSRWLPEYGRRETWPETVDRYMKHVVGKKIKESEPEYEELRNAILTLEVLPSMRALMTAGPALDRENIAGYNCSFLPIDHPRAFDEMLYILMNGTGVGFSVERQFVSKLPDVPEEFYKTETNIVVHDSKLGWAKAFKELIGLLYAGQVPTWDLSKVRPAGAPLKTFGGRASGPEPLNDLFRFTVNTFQKAKGRKLTSLECHDISCKIGEVVVVGGVRRSALISLSNPSDDRMRSAKSGQWWNEHPERTLANNSACYTEKPEFEVFLKEWQSLYESKSGERGFFSRTAAKKQAAKNGRRETNFEFGTNPCSEIILRPYQFCNLTTVVLRPSDDIGDVSRKVRLATILGTVQASFTDFKYLRNVWKKNCEEEALLGVSMTGIMDHPLLGDPYNTSIASVLQGLKEVAVETNKEWAYKIGINQATAITCVKPEGTVSQLTNTASGIHPRFSKYYIRRVRGDVKDPLSTFMHMNDFPNEQDVVNSSNRVFSFPIAVEGNCKTVADVTAIYQLDLWKVYQDNWCEHKPSCTAYYSDDEFLAVGSWLWKNFDAVSGISFLPKSDHIYKQAPYEEITKGEYDKLSAAIPKEVDWSSLSVYETEDNTVGSQTLNCTAGACEVVDLTK